MTAALILLLTACTNPVPWLLGENGRDEPSSSERADTGFIVTGPNSYDSADTAILVDRDAGEGTATF